MGWEHCGIPKCSVGATTAPPTTTAPPPTTTTTTTTPAIASEDKPVAIAFVPTSFFIYKTKGKTWREARQACQENGGDLASLARNKEKDSLWAFVPQDTTHPSWTGGYWIGAVRKTMVGSHPPKKRWLWLTGEPILNIQDDSADDCATYYHRKGDSMATITDDKCDEKRPGYICQFKSNLLQFIP